jgi:hypothetical protein
MNALEDELRAAMTETAEEIRALEVRPLVLPAGSRRAGASGRREQRWRRWLIPIAAAGVVLAVAIASVVIAGLRPSGASRHFQPAIGSGPFRGAPRYYVEIALTRAGDYNGPEQALIRSTSTGAVLATISPPKPYRTLVAVTGNAGDRAFVLAALRGGGKRGAGPYSFFPATRLFLLRLTSAGRPRALTPLPIPEFSDYWTLTGLALSPGGSRLAVGLYSNTTKQQAEMRIYSVSTGASRTWKGSGGIGFAPYDSGSVSLPADLADVTFMWSGGDLKSDGLRLLDLASQGTSLVRDSRFAVADPQPNGADINMDATLTPDGMRIAAVMAPGNGSNYIDEFSVPTGRVVWADRRPPGHGLSYQDVLWTNGTGSVLIIDTIDRSGGSGLGIVRNGEFTPLPGPPMGHNASAWAW